MRYFKLSTRTLLPTLLLLAGCTASDEPFVPTQDGNEEPEAGRMTVCANATMPHGEADTRLVYNETDGDNGCKKLNITWAESGEEFAVTTGVGTEEQAYGFKISSVDPADAHNANFSGELPKGIADGTTVYALYPYPNEVELDAQAFPIDLTGQDGGMKTQNGYDLDDSYGNVLSLAPMTSMYAKTTYSSSSETLNFEFSHLTALLRLTLQFDGRWPSIIRQVILSADNLAQKATVDVTGESPSYKVTETGVLDTGGDEIYPKAYLKEGGNTDNDCYRLVTVYFALLPGQSMNNIRIATFASDYSQRFKGTLKSVTSLDAGVMYSATIQMDEEKNATMTLKVPETYANQTIIVEYTDAGSNTTNSVSGIIKADGSVQLTKYMDSDSSKLDFSLFREGNEVKITIANQTSVHVITADEVDKHEINLSSFPNP